MLPDHTVIPADISRAAVAAAFEEIDPASGSRVRRDHRWQHTFARHLTSLDRAVAQDPSACSAVAAAGLATAHELFAAAHGQARAAGRFTTETVIGTGAPVGELLLPHRGALVGGHALVELVGRWSDHNLCVPSVASAVEQVVRHPEWLSLAGDTIVVLGASAKLSAYAPLTSWGARVVAVDLPGENRAASLRGQAAGSAGTAHLPVTDGGGTGADLTHGIEPLVDWLTSFDGRLVVVDALRADEGRQFELALIADALVAELVRLRPDTALAYYATPADSYLVRTIDMSVSRDAYAAASRPMLRAARSLSRGIALQPNFPHLTLTPVVDAHMPQHTWDFASAKRIQRWRAADAVARGTVVSSNVAPATVSTTMGSPLVTRLVAGSVAKSGITPFEVETARTLMAALLVHDLRTDDPAPSNALDVEYEGAVHGGMWTTPYKPSSVVGLADKGRKLLQQAGLVG